MSAIAVAHGFGTTRTVARPNAQPSQHPVCLTRRGRLVLLATFAVMVFAALTVLGGQSAATRQPGQPVETRMVEVAEGQTLWGIADEVAGPGEVREMIHRIQELNALPGSGVAVGQEIAVPVG